MANSLEALVDSFLQEAKNAPKLFNDLAKVEQYIAESYKTRALIELLQNADDAQSEKFGIHDFTDGFAVGNNGQSFTIEDVEAICRSGASDKRRGGNTIGYRGIGFKSVVNLAKSVYVLSGEYAFSFDRDKTRSIFADAADVPLIRIPHKMFHADNEKFFHEADQLKKNFGYSTLFIFQGLNERLLAEEIFTFDRGCLLFLNNIRSVELDFRGSVRQISVKPIIDTRECSLLNIIEKDCSDVWKIYRSSRDAKNIVALKKEQDTIIPAQPDESVFHSFTPTTEFVGAFLKINGDYSTDPSRKSLDMDEHSLRSLTDTVELLAEIIIDLLNGTTVEPGFFTPFSNTRQDGWGKSKAQLLTLLSKQLHSMNVKNVDGVSVPFSSLRLRPDWFSYEDYEQICGGDITCVRKNLLGQYPELLSFLSQMNVPTLSLQETLNKANQRPVSRLGNAQIFTKIVKQFRYDLDPKKIQEIKQLKIFPVGKSTVSSKDVESTSDLNQEFLQFVFLNNDAPDLKPFWNKLGISASKEVEDSFSIRPITSLQNSSAEHTKSSLLAKGFKAEPNLKQWRSAEQNAEEYIKALNGVLEVTDLSKANLGYDLEIVLEGNNRLFVEVKSVSSFADPFRLTNNEYTSAHQYGEKYLVAMVINGTPFQIRIIQNPIANVELHKQCERWSWYCDNYVSQLNDILEII